MTYIKPTYVHVNCLLHASKTIILCFKTRTQTFISCTVTANRKASVSQHPLRPVAKRAEYSLLRLVLKNAIPISRLFVNTIISDTVNALYYFNSYGYLRHGIAYDAYLHQMENLNQAAYTEVDIDQRCVILKIHY